MMVSVLYTRTIDEVLSCVQPVVLFEVVALNGKLLVQVRPKFISPTNGVASPDGSKLYVAEQMVKRIDMVNGATNTVITRIFFR